MQLKTMTGLAIFVLLFGIAAIPLMHYADAAYGSSSGYSTATKDAMKDKAKDAMKDKATGSTSTSVSIAKGSSSPGCDTTNSCYDPSSTSVSVGGTITWKNGDTASHTVTSGTPTDGPDGKFDSSLFGPGKTFSNKFDTAGTYNYFCMVHPWMKGTVTVS